jgi:crotonobetainyl-CoA:carnitine CoA-transferase CaiB-like acyl-CoA transferase
MARRVFQAIGQEALFDEPRFNTNAARLAHDTELTQLIASTIAGLDQAECLAHFRRHGVTVGPVYDAEQLLGDAHVAARGSYIRVPDDDEGAETLMHGITPKLGGTPGQLRRRAPVRGEHGVELLNELGATEEQIASLNQRGALESR